MSDIISYITALVVAVVAFFARREINKRDLELKEIWIRLDLQNEKSIQQAQQLAECMKSIELQNQRDSMVADMLKNEIRGMVKQLDILTSKLDEKFTSYDVSIKNIETQLIKQEYKNK